MTTSWTRIFKNHQESHRELLCVIERDSDSSDDEHSTALDVAFVVRRLLDRSRRRRRDGDEFFSFAAKLMGALLSYFTVESVRRCAVRGETFRYDHRLVGVDSMSVGVERIKGVYDVEVSECNNVTISVLPDGTCCDMVVPEGEGEVVVFDKGSPSELEAWVRDERTKKYVSD